MKSKYIFLDIDGTLVNFEGVLPPSAGEAMREAHERGHKLVICTGRQYTQIYPWLLEAVPFDGVISSSGANVRAGGETVARHVFPTEKLSFLVDYFRETNTAYCMQTQDVLLLESWSSKIVLGYFEERGIDLNKLTDLFGRISVADEPERLRTVEKIVYYLSPKSLDEVAQDIGGEFRVVRYSFGSAPGSCGEVSRVGVDKATGMAELLQFFGAGREDCIAFGDGDNDLEMLDFAAVGVAMGNATKKLKAVADEVTDDIDADGLYNGFKRLGLI